MAEQGPVELTFEKGLFTGGDRLRLPKGALSRLQGWYYRLGDPTRVWKIPGRTSAGSLGTSTDVAGLKHFQYENQADVLVALADGKLYESDAGLSGLSFSSVQNEDGDDYVVGGSYLRAVHDGRNQWWAVTGDGNRPLIRDLDGSWRRAGLLAPEPIPEISKITEFLETVWPDSSTGDAFTYPERAYDDDPETAALGDVPTWSDIYETIWSFPSGHTFNNSYYLNLDIEGGKVTRQRTDTSDEQDVIPQFGRLTIFISYDGGSTWCGGWSISTRMYRRIRQIRLGGHRCPHSGDFDSGNLRVKIALRYHTRSTDEDVRPDKPAPLARIYEIFVTPGNPEPLHPGSYGYAITEMYRKTLSDGSVVEVESPPTPVRTVVIGDNEDVFGLLITLPDIANTEEDGYNESDIVRRVYRTTSTGTWPDLGLIAEIYGDDDTFLDDFTSVSYDDIGVPMLPVVNVGDAWFTATGTPPPLLDACLYRGSLVGISQVDPRIVCWSVPANPEAWPTEIHVMRLLPTERQDRLKAIISLGDVILLFSRNQVFRVRGLPFANRPGFDIAQADVTVLSPAVGLAGTPASVCLAHAFDGYPLVFWISDNGIWMTDGGLPSERGMGVMKVSLALDWDRDVDTSSLDETVLSYDTANQLLRFQYRDPGGNRREIWFHVAPEHWVQLLQQGKPVPKASGPHPAGNDDAHLVDLAAGEHSGIFRTWSLSSDGTVYLEMNGTRDEGHFSDAGTDIVSVLETGWIYAGGPFGRATVQRGACYHTDWGDHTLALEIRGRTDRSGTSQHAVKSDISLEGERVTVFPVARGGGGQSIWFRLIHRGSATGALGALALDVKPDGEDW